LGNKIIALQFQQLLSIAEMMFLSSQLRCLVFLVQNMVMAPLIQLLHYLLASGFLRHAIISELKILII
jgi:hypothetical protein